MSAFIFFFDRSYPHTLHTHINTKHTTYTYKYRVRAYTHTHTQRAEQDIKSFYSMLIGIKNTQTLMRVEALRAVNAANNIVPNNITSIRLESPTPADERA